jgi:hypothetical protein
MGSEFWRISLFPPLCGSTEALASVLAISLATPDDEASDEELASQASDKGPFSASPMLSMIGEPSPSIAKANSSRSFKQVHGSEGELAIVNIDVVSK